MLAGVAARAQRREYMQLLSDCQRLYCEARLALVADVVAARMAEYMREPLPSLTRGGCSYLMQVRRVVLLLHCKLASTNRPRGAAELCVLCSGCCPSSAAAPSGPDRPCAAAQVCQMEHQLHDQFFPEADGDGTVLAPLMDPLCTVLYDALRPAFIQLQSLEALCNLADILQHEVCLSWASPGDVVGQQGTPASPAACCLGHSLARMLMPQQQHVILY